LAYYFAKLEKEQATLDLSDTNFIHLTF